MDNYYLGLDCLDPSCSHTSSWDADVNVHLRRGEAEKRRHRVKNKETAEARSFPFWRLALGVVVVCTATGLNLFQGFCDIILDVRVLLYSM